MALRFGLTTCGVRDEPDDLSLRLPRICRVATVACRNDSGRPVRWGLAAATAFGLSAIGVGQSALEALPGNGVE
jgi:hypothetical protein